MNLHESWPSHTEEPENNHDIPADAAFAAEPAAESMLPARSSRPEPRVRYARVSEPDRLPEIAASPSAASPYSVNLERHQRKCRVCQHPDREALDADFIHWHNPEDIAIRYKIYDRTTIYRHARATGLYQRRRSNMRCILEHILESASRVKVGAHSVLRALHAYSRVSDTGVWTDSPAQIIVSAGAPAALASSQAAIHALRPRSEFPAPQLSGNPALPANPALSRDVAARAVLIATEMHAENEPNA